MFGKTFESMYDGSMYGAGPVCFALMGYVIAKTRKSRIELNPKKLSDTFGCSQEEVEKAILWATTPDGQSRNKKHEGRRLVKEGMFQYFVPSWEYYRGLRDEDDRREYNRNWMADKREKEKQEQPDALDIELARKKPSSKKLSQIIAELDAEGVPTNTHDWAAKLREIHGLENGEDGSDDGLTPEERKAAVREKISKAEAAEEKVRRKINPDYAEKHPE